MINIQKETPNAGEIRKKVIDKSPPSYYCYYDNMHVPREVRIKFQPWETVQKEERERERENIAKYMGRVEHYMVSTTIEVASGAGVLQQVKLT